MRAWALAFISLGLLAQAPAPPQPVLVELYTSEANGNCPPADALLLKLAGGQSVAGAHIIPLSLHVVPLFPQPWDDPYALQEATDRQRAYGRVFKDPSSYLPEMVVDGAPGFVGSVEADATAAIAKAAANPKLAIDLKKDGRDLQVTLHDLSGAKGKGTLELWLALTEDGLSDKVKKGDNEGQTIAHAGVVRELRSLGTVDPVVQNAFNATAPIKTAWTWHKDNLHAVVFLQARESGRILGAAELKLF